VAQVSAKEYNHRKWAVMGQGVQTAFGYSLGVQKEIASFE
jgi:hypothetical protein